MPDRKLSKRDASAWKWICKVYGKVVTNIEEQSDGSAKDKGDTGDDQVKAQER